MAKFHFKNVSFLMQKLLSASTSTIPLAVSASPSSSFTVEYLVSSCGVPLKSAISIAASKKILLQEEKIQRYDSVLSLLTSHGFDQTHIALMMNKCPSLLSCKVDGNLRPKLEYLNLNGFSGCYLHNLIVSNPYMLKISLSSAIKPSLEFLRSILGTEERVLLAVKRSSRLVKSGLAGKLKANVDLLVKEGVALDDVVKFFIIHSYLMTPSTHRLVAALRTVRDQLGIEPSDRTFLVAVMRIASFGVPIWEKKIQVFKSFGFCQRQALCIIRRFPNCLSRSEETLRTKLSFYLSTVKLKLDDVASYPNMLSLAIETRSRPRHNVLRLLLSKKLLKRNAKLPQIFTMGEDKFLNKYIINYVHELPSLMEMYANDKIKKNVDI